MADDINVTINSLYLFIPNLIPSVETQSMFNEATRNYDNISYDERYSKKRLLLDLLVQQNIVPTQQANSPKYLIGAHQTRYRLGGSDKKNCYYC